MTIAALITEGIGPGGSVKYLLTGGLDIGSGALPMSATMSGVGAITANLSAPTMAAMIAAIGALTGTVVPAPSLGGGPDEYWDEDSDYRPWWYRTKRQAEALEARLRAMREEIGLLPRAEVKKAEKAVERAARAIIERPASVKSETAAFQSVAAFERNYRQALRKVLAKARQEDAERDFREQVRLRLVEKAQQEERARQKVLDESDEAILLQIATWL